MKARMVLMGGLGYPATETTWGMPTFKTRLAALGIEILLISWKARQQCYDYLHGFKGWRGLAGDSLGAGSAAEFAGDLDSDNTAGHLIDYVAGFQPSLYDSRAHNGYITVAGNCLKSHCIYDPEWIDTFGLGAAQYTITPNSATKLLVTQHRGAHPDDWGYSQDLIFNEIKSLLEKHK